MVLSYPHASNPLMELGLWEPAVRLKESPPPGFQPEFMSTIAILHRSLDPRICCVPSENDSMPKGRKSYWKLTLQNSPLYKKLVVYKNNYVREENRLNPIQHHILDLRDFNIFFGCSMEMWSC